MASLHYLTVQDVLWINLQVTKKVQRFSYARLEEAVFYQYAYGESNTLLPQAARFVNGFVKMHPFDAGNEATALVALLAFLGINGRPSSVTGEVLKSWFGRAVVTVNAELVAEIASAESHDHHGIPDIQATVLEILDRFAEVFNSLPANAAA